MSCWFSHWTGNIGNRGEKAPGRTKGNEELWFSCAPYLLSKRGPSPNHVILFHDHCSMRLKAPLLQKTTRKIPNVREFATDSMLNYNQGNTHSLHNTRMN